MSGKGEPEKVSVTDWGNANDKHNTPTVNFVALFHLNVLVFVVV